MMRLPTIVGVIRRRMLVNFRADVGTVQKLLPAGMRPKLQDGHAVVGVCLIRLEEMRPVGLPAGLGISSENAAHRFAVRWTDRGGAEQEGVYIPRRDTDSRLNALAGGRLFPGETNHSEFQVDDDGARISFVMKSTDGEAAISLKAKDGERLPAGSVFSTVDAASDFFQPGCVGYSATRGAGRLDGIRLETESWKVAPLDVWELDSSYFADRRNFPEGSIVFDHALMMRDISHQWHGVPDFAAVED